MPTSTPHPTPPPTGRTFVIKAPQPIERYGWTVRPLGLVAPSAVGYADSFGGCCIGVAVAIPSQGIVYTLNGDLEFEALSIAKVPIMLAFLEQAALEKRELPEADLALLHSMITESDNFAADTLWNLAGGAKGVHATLTQAGIEGLELGRNAWGESLFTAEQTARLLAAVVDGTAFHAQTRRVALDLMQNVVAWQAWGVGSGLPEDAVAGVKNGWFLEPGGWALHTTGYVIPKGGDAYTIAIFSLGMKDYTIGLAEVEAIARRIHSDLFLRR